MTARHGTAVSPLISGLPIANQEVIAMLCTERASRGRRVMTLVLTVVMAISLWEGAALAQVPVTPVTASPVAAAPGPSALHYVHPPADTARQGEPRSLQPIRDSLRMIDYGSLARQRAKEGLAQPAGSRRTRSVGRRILGGAIGATAGLFAGGYLGTVIEGDSCHCDDPGLKGALIGAPVGMVAGGILGALFF
jgi:hypothetical protein